MICSEAHLNRKSLPRGFADAWLRRCCRLSNLVRLQTRQSSFINNAYFSWLHLFDYMLKAGLIRRSSPRLLYANFQYKNVLSDDLNATGVNLVQPPK